MEQTSTSTSTAELRVENATLSTPPTVIALRGGPGFDQGCLRPGLAARREFAQVVYVELRSRHKIAWRHFPAHYV
jgi:hypothetical protein